MSVSYSSFSFVVLACLDDIHTVSIAFTASHVIHCFLIQVERLNHYANSLESEEATLAKALPADGYPSATAATSSTTSREKTAKAPPASAVVTPSWPQEGALQFDNLRVSVV